MVKKRTSVLFLPGLNCTGALFEPQIRALSPRYDCHVADHGATDDIENLVKLILNHAPEQFAAVGLSMGGYLALEILRQQPKRVTSLVLLDTRASADTTEDAERRRRTIEFAGSGHFDALHAVLWPRLVHPGRQSDTALETIVKGMMADTGAERFIRQQTALINRPDYLAGLAKIDIPVLVGVGREDLITPPDMAQDLTRGIKGAELEIFENCGHLSTLERPQEVTKRIEVFLDSAN